MNAAPNTPRYQVVICDGPRCRARGALAAHLAHLQDRLEEPPLRGRVCAGQHHCLGRCPAGPNLVVRELGEGPEDPRPGMYALAGGAHFHRVTRALLDRILDEHCAGRPLQGRFQPY